MAYVENIKVGSGETWPVRDVEAQEAIEQLLTDMSAVNESLSAKAPAGFGLGEGGMYVDNMHVVRGNGWFYTNEATLNTPLAYGYGVICRRTSNTCVYLMWGATDTDPTVQVKTNDGGTTWVTEWLNPPRIAGVEYRTTERLSGKPIYTMAIGTGDLPAGGSKTLNFAQYGATNVAGILECYGFATSGQTIPYDDGDLTIKISATTTDVVITTNKTVASGYPNGTIIIKYYKSE